MATRFVPVTITALLRCRDGRELKITAGDCRSKDRRRFLELTAVQEQHRVQLEWAAGSYEQGPDASSPHVAIIRIDDHDPVPVLAHSDRLLAYDEADKSSSKQFAPKELGWVGEYLLNLKTNPAGMFRLRGTSRFITEEDALFGFESSGGGAPGAVGCLSDWAGAGAGLGATGGAIAGAEGGPAGVAAGAAVGGAVGAAAGGAAGVGYCVVGPVFEAAWDWLTGDDDE